MFIQVCNSFDNFIFPTKPFFSVQQDLSTFRSIISIRQRITRIIKYIWEYELSNEEKESLLNLVKEQNLIRDLFQNKKSPQNLKSNNAIENNILNNFIEKWDEKLNNLSLEEALQLISWEEGNVNAETCSWKSHDSKSDLENDSNSQKILESKMKKPIVDLQTLPQAVSFLYNNTIANYFIDQKISCSIDQLRKSYNIFKQFILKNNKFSIMKVMDNLEKLNFSIEFFIFGRKIDCQQIILEVKRDLKKRFKDRYTDKADLEAKWEHLIKTNIHTTKVNVKWELINDVLVNTFPEEKNKSTSELNNEILTNNINQENSPNQIDNSTTTNLKEIESHIEGKSISPIKFKSINLSQISLDSPYFDSTLLYSPNELASYIPQYPVLMNETKKRKRIVSDNNDYFFSLQRFAKEERIGKRRLIIPKEHLISNEMLSFLSNSNTILYKLGDSLLQQQLIDIDKSHDRKAVLLSMMKNFPELERLIDESLFILGEKEHIPNS